MPSESEKRARARMFMDIKVRIESGADGGPARIIPRRGHRKPLGRYISLKARRGMLWESFHERHLMWICEADTAVVSFKAQPHKLTIWMPELGKNARYTPDLLRVLADGTKEVIEVKRRRDEVSRDELYEEKLARAAQGYAHKGFVFRIMTAADDIEIEPIFSNAKRIQTDRFTRYGAVDELRFREAIEAADGTLPYAKATEILSATGERDDPLARARLHAFIVRRIASVDIHKTLRADSPVSEIENKRKPRKRA
jgi:hypothetical protein